MSFNKIDRNYALDILRFICAFMIVVIHCGGQDTNIIRPITRCAVPTFFMISGYFLFSNKPEKINDKIKKHISTTIQILLWSSSFFFIYKETLSILKNGCLFIPSSQQWINFIIFNENPFEFHLWYLASYVYVLLIFLMINKFNLWKICFFIVPLLLLMNLAIGKYSQILFNESFSIFVSRSTIFTGLPYTLLGCAICKFQKERILKAKYIYIFFIIFFWGLLSLEKYLLDSSKTEAVGDIYISTTFLCVCIFVFFSRIHLSKKNILSELGRKYSLLIYIFHPIFIGFAYKICRKAGDIETIVPIVVFILSLLLSIIFIRTKNFFITILSKKMS